MAKILVVDDEADLELLIKQKFRRKIRENEYQFFFAQHGLQALEIIGRHHDIDMVLSDINMPEMDGLTLLSRLTQANPALKAVMVSAYSDLKNIRLAMNRGAFDFVCKPIDFQDLEITMEKTIQYVSQTRETLRAIRENNILKMYVDETVLKLMTREEFEKTLMLNETIEGTVLFADLCGFTSITERITPNSVVNLINQMFDLMVREIIALGGFIDKFMGDAVMAVFRGDFHQDRAVDAALALRERLEAFDEVELDGVRFRPRVSVGINSGEMVSGNIGSASLKRLDYTVIGDTVNLAQRLQTLAGPGQVLIHERVYEAVKESFRCQPIGEVSLKNKQNPVSVYEVIE